MKAGDRIRHEDGRLGTFDGPLKGWKAVGVVRFDEHPEQPTLEAVSTLTALPLEACPGCGCMPGDGKTLGCTDPLGCGAPELEDDFCDACKQHRPCSCEEA